MAFLDLAGLSRFKSKLDTIFINKVPASKYAENTISTFESNCHSIEAEAFRQCGQLTSVSIPMCKEIGPLAFCSCSSLNNVYAPECIRIGCQAFEQCRSINEISMPICTTIEDSAFFSCTGLSSVYFPACTYIGENAFCGCGFSIISFPRCSIIGSRAFSGCENLEYAYFAECHTIGEWAFQGISGLGYVSVPKCSLIMSGAFYGVAIESILLPECSQIMAQAFAECTDLKSVYLLYSSVVSLGASAFYDTPMTTTSYGGYGSIYVPQALLNSYKTTTNWSALSSRIVGLTDGEVYAVKNGMVYGSSNAGKFLMVSSNGLMTLSTMAAANGSSF